MSEYTVVDCDISSQEEAISGLVAIGVPLDCIDVFETPQNLEGYHGDVRNQKANIIVRRKHVNKYLSSGASNDLGFELVDGRYIAHVSRYDKGWWGRKEETFRNEAAATKVERLARKRGYKVVRSTEDNKIRLKLKKNF